MCYYFLRIGLPHWDWFFGNRSKSYTRSNSLADPFPGRILLQARRKYASKLVHARTYFSSMGWHHSLHNHQYHYTLRGYNALGWMTITLEMGTSGRMKVFTYGPKIMRRLMYATFYLEGILDLGP
ncbi:hypothetical protein EDD18DRAFT_1116505 [Armillaria luteobubalina]|uniref:Uncharacterized protein n=1 Tax=Armillaria luteobubalina TaxID=153913 RepID=A0AA39NZZ4_9AGAR|nr:hypothetical protein EDD18DRAFT_1116505 [Armillaria luteobubalina]